MHKRRENIMKLDYFFAFNGTYLIRFGVNTESI